jgi:hypothetical protein
MLCVAVLIASSQVKTVPENSAIRTIRTAYIIEKHLPVRKRGFTRFPEVLK